MSEVAMPKRCNAAALSSQVSVAILPQRPSFLPFRRVLGPIVGGVLVYKVGFQSMTSVSILPWKGWKPRSLFVLQVLISVQFLNLETVLSPISCCQLHVQDFGDHKIYMYSGFGRINPHLLSLKLMHVCWLLLYSYYVILCLFLTDIQPCAPYHCKYMQITGNLQCTRVTICMYRVPFLCSLQAVVLSISTAIHKCCKGRNVSTVIHKCCKGWNKP